MSLINIIIGAGGMILVALGAGSGDKKWVLPTMLAITPPLTYLIQYSAGLAEFIPSVALGHAIGLIIILLIFRAANKQVKETENRPI